MMILIKRKTKWFNTQQTHLKKYYKVHTSVSKKKTRGSMSNFYSQKLFEKIRILHMETTSKMVLKTMNNITIIIRDDKVIHKNEDVNIYSKCMEGKKRIIKVRLLKPYPRKTAPNLTN